MPSCNWDYSSVVSDWLDVAPEGDFAPSSFHVVEVDELEIAVFRLSDGFYAIEDLCSHAESTLSDGKLRDDEIHCPMHGARFSIKTGAALSPPAYEAIATYPVRIENGMVQVRNYRKE